MAEFKTVCRENELPVGEAKTVEINGKLVALFHKDDGFHAIDDVCPHMGASLSTGLVEGDIVTCPWHGWRFRVTDGVWADNPRIKIGCYPVRVHDGQVQIQVNPNPPRPNSSVPAPGSPKPDAGAAPAAGPGGRLP